MSSILRGNDNFDTSDIKNRISVPTAYHMYNGNLEISNTVLTTGFSTALHVGNGTSQNVTTGIDMSTQWGNDASETFGGLVWGKSRSNAISNCLFDTVRGALNRIESNSTSAQVAGNGVSSFTSTGFSLVVTADLNTNLATYVSWNFQTTHRRTGTTNHGKAFTEHYNPFTGFTIIKFEGSGLAGHEIPHSLGMKLGFVTVKNLSAVSSWRANPYFFDGQNLSLRLDGTDAQNISSAYGFTNTEIAHIISNGVDYNASTNQYVMYGWANSYFDEDNTLIGNYEIGTYQGTGVAGNKVTTRSKPAWVMVKRLDSTGDWAVKDNLRGSTKLLYANASVAEETDQNVDFSVDGFIIQNTNTDMNTSGGQYLYMVVYDNDSGSGKSKYPRTTDTSNIQVNNAIIPFAQGIDSNGTKVSTISKNESITGLTYTAGKNYVYALENGTYGVKPFRPRYLRSDLVAEKAGDNPDYFDVLSNTWYSTVANPELVTNGTFTSNTTGWTLIGTTTPTVSNGSIVLTTGTADGGIYQILNTVIGKKYVVKAAVSSSTCTTQVCLSTTKDINRIGSIINGILYIEFIAQQTSTPILFTVGVSAGSAYIDNISVYATDLAIGSEITTGRNYLNTIVYADASGQLTYVEELPKTQYIDSLQIDRLNLRQSWQNVTSERKAGITYTNSTGKPIQVINGHTNSGGGAPSWYINGTLMLSAGTNPNSVGVTSVMCFIVPNGATYRYDGIVSAWLELR